MFLDLGVPAIAKRKPPSQRAERQPDDTARAIAQAREASAAKPDKADDEEKSKPGSSFSQTGRIAQSVGLRKPSSSPAASASTKRNKSGGG